MQVGGFSGVYIYGCNVMEKIDGILLMLFYVKLKFGVWVWCFLSHSYQQDRLKLRIHAFGILPLCACESTSIVGVLSCMPLFVRLRASAN